ncbi:hypothetical protein [Streptomyces sp. NPDC018610]|uniref:hypothetical protein n=1 Tax=Streptomyces sp. NPDC018610 TaxID=3365049 RepID=UPI0037BC1D53
MLNGVPGRVRPPPRPRAEAFTCTSTLALRPDGTTVLVSTGPVTSGDHAGHTITNTVVITSTDVLACATPSGLTSTAGPFLISIL